MDKIAVLGVTPHVIPKWEKKNQQMYHQACERLSELPPVMTYTEAPPIKICEMLPTPVCGRGKMEHYQKAIAKCRKKNKNKKTHRR